MEIDSVGHKFIESDSGSGKQVERLISDSLFFLVPLEVELPRVDRVRNVTFFVSDGQTDLDHLGFFDISAYENILLIFLTEAALTVLPSSRCYDTGELSVLFVRNYVPWRLPGISQ